MSSLPQQLFPVEILIFILDISIQNDKMFSGLFPFRTNPFSKKYKTDSVLVAEHEKKTMTMISVL